MGRQSRSYRARPDSRGAAEKAYADPARFIGTDVSLAGDVLSIQQCRDTWREVMGRPPHPIPMPVWLFERFAGTDETTMWKWLRESDMPFDPRPTGDIHPGARALRDWLADRKAP